MIIAFDRTWLLENKLERIDIRLPSGYPGAAVRASLELLGGTLGSAVQVKWADATGRHDFATARTLDTTTDTVTLTADELQGVDTLSLINPAVQTAIVRVVVGVEAPEGRPGDPALLS